MSGTVSVGVGANVTALVSAFDQVREAIRRTGQEGKQLADIDFSHPELSSFAADVGRVRQQLEDLTRISSGETARAAKRWGGEASYNPFGSDASRDMAWTQSYPDQAQRARVRRQFESYVFRDTSFSGSPQYGPPAPPAGSPGGGAPTPGGAPPPAPPAPPPPPPLTSGDRAANSWDGTPSGPGIGSTLMGLMKGPVGMLAGLAGITGIGSMVGQAFSGAVEEGSQNDKLYRNFGGSTDFEKLRDAVRQAADGLGLTYQQAQQLALTFEKVGTRASTLEHVADDVRLAAGMARSYGGDAGSFASMLARGQAAGIGTREFAGLASSIHAEGGMSGKVESVMEALLRYTEANNRIMVGADNGHNRAGFAAMYAGLNADGRPGLRGSQGEALIGQLDGAVRAGGYGGLASQALNYRAFARHGVADPYEMTYLQEGGMFQQLRDGKTLYEVEREGIDRQYRGRPKMERLHAYSRHFGISMHQAEALDDVQPADLTRARKLADASGVNTTHLDPTAYADLAKLARESDRGVIAYRDKLLGRSDVTEEEKGRLKAASGEGLRQEAARVTAAHGMEKTEASRYQDATTSMANSMTKLGEHLIEPLTAIKDIAGKMLTGIDTMAKFFTTGPKEGTGALRLLPAPSDGASGGAEAAVQGMVHTIGYRPGGGLGGGLAAVGGRLGGGGGRVGGGGEAALPEGVAKARAQQAYDFFRSQGWSEENAAGHVAGIQVESGFRTGAVGDRGISGGIGQWNGKRREKFRELFGHDVTEGTFQEQLEFYQWELTHTEKSAGDKIRQQTTAYGSGDANSRYFERPRDTEMDARRRGNLAERLLPGLRAGAGQGGAGGAGVPAGGVMTPGGGFHGTIAPLRVIHEDSRGNVLRTEMLPVAAVRQPRAYGT